MTTLFPDPKVQAIQQALTTLTNRPLSDTDDLSSEITQHLASMEWIEVRFAISYLYSGNRAAAAKDVGIRREYTYNSNRAEDDDFEGRVNKLIELMKVASVKTSMQLIQLASVKAAGVLIACLDNPNAATRIRAAKILLEYGAGKPVARTVTEGKVEHEHHMSKIYAVDPGWPGVNVEHVAPSEDEIIDGEATYPVDD